eukprot:SAG11_NODE_983_length_6306_cov_19.831319_1_plen_88_part_00
MAPTVIGAVRGLALRFGWCQKGSGLGTILRELLGDERSGLETAEESGEDDEIEPIGLESPRMANLRERLNELRIGRVSPVGEGSPDS